MTGMTDVPALNCRELVELVTDYLEGVLPPATTVRFEAHLQTCPHCRLYLDQMRQTIGTLGRLPAETFPPHALDVLLKHFRTWRRA